MRFEQQLTLDLRLRDEATFANFVVGDNTELVGLLDNCSGTDLNWFIYLWGMPGSGRSHLLQAACHAAVAAGLNAIYLPLSSSQISSDYLAALENVALVCLDDIDLVVGDANWEEAIFHLYNRMQTTDSRLLLAAASPSRKLLINLADLRSRLSAGITMQVKPLTDGEKIEALILRANNRGLNLSFEVASYLLTHCSRDMQSLFAILTKLDAISWQEQRRITIPLVRTVLAKN